MLGLVLIYFIGKVFYDLAGMNGKNKWGFAILGVVAYYGGSFLGPLLIYILAEFGVLPFKVGETALTFIGIPFGALTCWGTYMLLKTQWNKSTEKVNREEVLDGDLLK
jgi:hypothetical protein